MPALLAENAARLSLVLYGIALGDLAADRRGNPSCWLADAGLTYSRCCDTRGGTSLEGNEACWDAARTFARCCHEGVYEPRCWQIARANLHEAAVPLRKSDPILLMDEMYLVISCCMHGRNSACWGSEAAVLAQPSPRYEGVSALFAECCLPTLRWWLNASSPPLWMGELLEAQLQPWRRRRPVTPTEMDDFERKHEGIVCRFRLEGGRVQSCRWLDVGNRSGGCHEGSHILTTFVTVLHILLHLARLPDIEFFLSCVEDFEPLLGGDPPVPLLAQVRRPWTPSALLVPHSHLLSLWSRRMEYEVPVVDTPWRRKVSRAVFRGAPNGRRPHFLARASESVDPELLDARLVADGTARQRQLRQQAAADFADVWANESFWGWPLTLQQQLAFRYVLDLDGGGGPSDRFLWIGLSESVPVRALSPYESWIGALPQPFEHFVPVQEDGSDLAGRLAWLRAHEGEAQRIALGSRLLVQRALRFEHALHWVFRLLRGLAATQLSVPSGCGI